MVSLLSSCHKEAPVDSGAGTGFHHVFTVLGSSLPRHSMYAIYAYIDPQSTTPTDRQSYGSPMECLG